MAKKKCAFLLGCMVAVVVWLTMSVDFSLAESQTRTVKVGWIADMTGPTAGSVIPMVWATQDWFKYVNDELGGIDGVKVEVIWGDAAYKLDLGLQLYNKFSADKDIVMIACCTTHINNAIAPKCMKDELVQYAPSPAPEAMYPVKWCYSHSAGYGDQLGAFIDWKLSSLSGERPLRLALMYMDVPFGKSIYDGGGVSYCKARGVEIVAEEALPPRTSDVTTNLRKTVGNEPDFVYYQGTVTQAAVIARDAQKINFKIPLCLSANSVPDQFVSLAGETAAEGVMMMSWSNPWHGVVAKEITADIQKVEEFFKRNRPKEDAEKVGVGYFHGLAMSIITTHAIKLALEKVAVKDLSGKTLKEFGFDRVKDFRETRGLTGPITYTAEDHRGGQYIKILGIENGLGYTVKDWFQTPYLVRDGCLNSAYVESGDWKDILK